MINWPRPLRLSFRDKTIIGIIFIEAILLVVLVWAMLDILVTSSANELTKRVQTTGRLFTATN